MKRQSYKELVPYIQVNHLSFGFRVKDFDCGFDEYNSFLSESALVFQRKGITATYILVDKRNSSIIAFFTLSSTAIKLSKIEKNEFELNEVNFNTIPAIKLGMMAVDKKYHEKYKGLGHFTLQLVIGAVNSLLEENTIGCRFVMVDADVKTNPGVDKFYEKFGFKYCQDKQYNRKNRKASITMSYDLFSTK